jgi:hypothetical protein
MLKLKGPVPPEIVTLRFADPPEQIVEVPAITADEIAGLTVTTAAGPLITPGQAVASVTAVKVYVVVDVGETDTVWPLLMLVKLKDDEPSEYVTLKGPVPVSENVSVDEAPLQIAVGAAATEPVGAGLTVTMAAPEPVPVHPNESVTLTDKA